MQYTINREMYIFRGFKANHESFAAKSVILQYTFIAFTEKRSPRIVSVTQNFRQAKLSPFTMQAFKNQKCFSEFAILNLCLPVRISCMHIG